MRDIAIIIIKIKGESNVIPELEAIIRAVDTSAESIDEQVPDEEVP